jgi:hypothetical protein
MDAQFLRENREKLQDIAYPIASLQDTGGLIMTSGELKVKFLMNNCEDYGGISAFIDIAHEMGWPLESYYKDVRRPLREGILRSLYHTEKGLFFRAIDGEVHGSGSSWETFYPDAYAQLFPILYGLLDDNKELRNGLWAAFNAHYGAGAESLPPEQKIMYELTKKAMAE